MQLVRDRIQQDMGSTVKSWWTIGAVVWGIAEASFFFIVPDVLLTVLVLRWGWKKVLRVAVLVAMAAALTGVAMAIWGATDAAGAKAVLLQIPAVGPDLIARVAGEMGSPWWAVHVVAGAVSGVPYKLYAVEAGARHFALLPFVVVSLAARLARFCLSIAITAGAAHGLDRIGRGAWKAPLLALGWFAIYAVYFGIRAAA
jgi:membrane protein YqaA with SNARE-associated domain